MEEFVSEGHPLSLELQSLRASVSRFQDEAHISAVKLQRHSLDAVRAHERAVYLQRENDALKAELAVLRSNPHPNGQASTTESQNQVQELILSLRRLSHKLSLTEEALLKANTDLAIAHASTVKASANADNAYELGARVRGREEEGLILQRELDWKVKKLEEELKMSDRVIQEYASLVRSMQARPPSETFTFDPQEFLKEGKIGLDRLFKELQEECDVLARKLDRNTAELEVCNAKLDAEQKANGLVLIDLGRTRTELSKLQLEDGTAAKMVSRYMQFSQTSTNKLLTTLNTLQTRHSSTLLTLSSQNHALSTQLRSLESQNERLRSALDELGKEIMKETYGRRREIAQRIRMGGREERLVEGLRRWVRRGDEMLDRLRGHGGGPENSQQHLDALLDMAQHARILLEGLDNGVLDAETALSLSGGLAREVLVFWGLDGLLNELNKGTERRLYLEKVIATFGSNQQPLKETGSFIHDVPPQVPEKIAPLSSATLCPSPPTPLRILESAKTTLPVAGAVDSENLIVTEPASPTPSREVSSLKDYPPLSLEINNDTRPTSPVLSRSESPVSVTKSETTTQSYRSIGTSSSIITTEVTPKTPSAQNPPPRIDGIIDAQEIVITDIANGNISAETSPDQSGAVDKAISLPTSIPPSLIPGSSTVTDALSFPRTTAVRDAVMDLNMRVVIQPHPMLAELAQINKRYDDLQRAFRDCHIALEGLKNSLSASSPTNGYPILPAFGHYTSTSSSPTPPATYVMPASNSSAIPTSILRAALGRLDDYTEDARVELEIRISDETLLAKGYEALLSVPGAMQEHQWEQKRLVNTDSPRDSRETRRNEHDDLEHPEIDQQIEAFITGTDPAVRKARDTFARKLEDVQHDIAALKRAIHDPQSFWALDISADGSELTSSLVSSHTENANGWTSWVRGPSPLSTSNPSTVTPSLGPSPTFGSIMTSPRLRSASSVGSFHQHTGQINLSTSRKGGLFGFGIGETAEHTKDPLSVLGLKVPMPSFTSPVVPQPSGLNGMSPTSPIGSTPRSRTVSSTMYMLGLGAAGPASPGHAGSPRIVRSPSGVAGGLLMHQHYPLLSHGSSSEVQQVRTGADITANGEGVETTDDEEEEEEEDSDIDIE